MRAHLMARLSMLGLALAAACGEADEPDAHGSFEAEEVVVSAQTSGQVLRFVPQEGTRLEAGTVAVALDPTQLTLERDAIAAQRSAGGARETEVGQHTSALRVQRDIARRAYERTRRLHAQQAATAQQLDQAEREYRVLEEELRAAGSQRQGAGREVAAADARLAQVRDRLARSEVRNPRAGTVLATFTREGEFVQAGQPLYRIANLDTLELRAYVDQPQLSRLRLGQAATVHVDRAGGERLALPGTVSWISAKAEFTPTPVATRDERASLVYAIKVRVPNRGGVLKIGMPADVELAATAAAGGGR